MYEHRTKKLISRKAFARRIFFHAVIMLAIIFFSLMGGIIGYHELAGLGWVDSLLNAAMILGGMGPVDQLSSNAAKIFAAFYAIYSGLVLIISVGVLSTPILHRLLHHFHWVENRN